MHQTGLEVMALVNMYLSSAPKRQKKFITRASATAEAS
jgi:hypothetical protein